MTIVRPFCKNYTGCLLGIEYNLEKKNTLTFKALNSMAPAYISDLIDVRKHTLRSNSDTILLHPAGKMKKKIVGDRSFSVAAPAM